MCAFFPLPRYGHVTLNTAESTNAWLLECRKRSPMKLFLKVINKVNARFADRLEMFTVQGEAAIVDKVFAEIVKNNENEEDSKHNSRQATSSPSSRIRKAMSGVSLTWKSECAHSRSSGTLASHASPRVLQPSLPVSTSNRCA